MSDTLTTVLENPAEENAGLSTFGVQERIKKGLINGDKSIKTKSYFEIFSTNTFTFFNFMFTVFAIILLAIGVPVSKIFFYGPVLINWIFGIIQEIRAKKTIDKLSLISAPKVSTIRDGKISEIAIKDIVLDDVVFLDSGHQICSDSVILDGELEVNESLITGEQDPIVKHKGDDLLSGSFVISGKAHVKVIHIGEDNYATKISNGAKYIKKNTSVILKALNKLIRFMAIVIMPIGTLLFLRKYLVDDVYYVEAISKTIGTLVGMIPAGLVALTSAVFCVSVIRISKNNTLAQDLYCIETLARVDTLCLDKTGTITEGVMEVTDIVPDKSISKENLTQLLKDLVCAVDDNNPTAVSLKNYTEGYSVVKTPSSVIPFASQRKWSGANFNDGTSAVIGAMEFVFSKDKKKYEKNTFEYSQKGYRVMVVAYSSEQIINNKLPDDLKFGGYILLADKIRNEAPQTLKYFAEQGVTIKIISGDNPITVKAVAERAGVKDFDNYIDASTLSSEEELKEAAEKYTIFGRVTPDQKIALIKALKAKGHTVGMTGDGVNDVLALKEADCSVAMAAGSAAAKNVAQLVLLDSNFASMPKIVAEGRRSVNNLERSASLFLIKTMYSTFIAVLFLFISTIPPFEANHLTFIGGVTIGMPSFILALENNYKRIEGQFLPRAVSGAIPSAFTIIVNILALVVFATVFDVTTEQFSTMALILTAVPGFIYLFKLCHPWTGVRVALFLVMISLFTGGMLLSFMPIVQKLFSLPDIWRPDGITKVMAGLIIPLSLIDIPVFIGFFYMVESLKKHETIEHFFEKAEKLTDQSIEKRKKFTALFKKK